MAVKTEPVRLPKPSGAQVASVPPASGRPRSSLQAPPIDPEGRSPEGKRSGGPADGAFTAPSRRISRRRAIPEDAAAEGVTGSVRLKVMVGRRGEVEDAQVVHSSGDERLDRAAEEAVRRWRYRPAHRAGRPVPAADYVRVEFYQDDEAKSEE